METENGIGHTKVWRVNRDTVVAECIEDAIKVYKDKYGDTHNDVKEVSLVDYHGNETALIRVSPPQPSQREGECIKACSKTFEEFRKEMEDEK